MGDTSRSSSGAGGAVVAAAVVLVAGALVAGAAHLAAAADGSSGSGTAAGRPTTSATPTPSASPSGAVSLPARWGVRSFSPAVVTPDRVVAAPPPMGQPVCRSTHLAVTAGRLIGTPTGMAQQIAVRNLGRATCSLSGRVGVSTGTGALLAAQSAPDIQLPPGRTATVTVTSETGCAAAGSHVTHAVLLRTGLVEAAVKSVQIDAGCATPDVMLDPPAGRPSRVAGSLAGLRVTATWPAGPRAGESLHYTVTLSNDTASPVSLADCPTISQQLAAPTAGGVRIFRTTTLLNCSAGAIAPHSAQTYAMVVRMPADLPVGGTTTLTWYVDRYPASLRVTRRLTAQP